MSDKIKSGILSVDKDAGMTSHDVVSRLRKILKTRRVGHAGTLDEMATGVLPVCFGRATRAVDYAQAEDKVYVAGVRLGVATDTQDIWGTVLVEKEVTLDEEAFPAILPRFVGVQTQLPPMYSAIKKNGKKLYELARQGIEIAREERVITINSIDLLSSDLENREYIIRVHCSKGVYIRTLCHDIGEALGCGAAMSSLRRTVNGRFTSENSHRLDEIERFAREGRLSELILPVDTLFDGYSRIVINRENEKRLRHGADIRLSISAERDMYRVYSEDGEFLALGRICLVKDQWTLRTIKSFFEKGDKDSDE